MKIELLEEIENEDGSVKLDWELDEEGTKHVAELGLKFLLYAGAAGLTLEEAFEKIVDHFE